VCVCVCVCVRARALLSKLIYQISTYLLKKWENTSEEQASVSVYNDSLTSWRSAVFIVAGTWTVLHKLTPHYDIYIGT
jgi:hypothetical protein